MEDELIGKTFKGTLKAERIFYSIFKTFNPQRIKCQFYSIVKTFDPQRIKFVSKE